ASSFFSSRRRHTRLQGDWSSDVCSSDLFAGLAVVLGAVGLYGVLAYLVAQRTNEIGIRMALGASRREVLRLVVRNGMQMTFAGQIGRASCRERERRAEEDGTGK